MLPSIKTHPWGQKSTAMAQTMKQNGMWRRAEAGKIGFNNNSEFYCLGEATGISEQPV
jgi:hypothetical protein